MLVGAGTAQLHQLRLEDALLEGDCGQGAQGGGRQVDRQQVLHQISQALAQLEAVAAALLVDLQGRIPVGVVGHEGDQGPFGGFPLQASQLGQFGQGEGTTLEVQDRLQPGGDGQGFQGQGGRRLARPISAASGPLGLRGRLAGLGCRLGTGHGRSWADMGEPYRRPQVATSGGGLGRPPACGPRKSR